MSIAQSHYNLLVSAHNEALEGLSWSVDKDRLFEYTSDIVRNRFLPLSDDSFHVLQSLPTVFAYERMCRKAARVGRITGISHRNDGYGVAFEFDPGIAPIAPEQLEALQHPLDIERSFELNRTHWAVKNVALASVLQQAGLHLPSATLFAPKAPIVFLSYSHDSVVHKAWVAQLGMDLRAYGIEVLLDQWHTRPGDDLALFMRRGVMQSEYVVMVCTEPYVSKILGNTGGASFEHMLVMGQLMQELGTSKFIPVIRQTAMPRQLIPALATRAYVDLSTDLQYRERVEELARGIHNQRPALPPLGRPPVPPPPVR